jgi:hypothetical protein
MEMFQHLLATGVVDAQAESSQEAQPISRRA